MLNKKIFDYKTEMQNCFSFNTSDGLPEFTTDSLYNAVYSIALSAKDKKIDFVCLESDFLRFVFDNCVFNHCLKSVESAMVYRVEQIVH